MVKFPALVICLVFFFHRAVQGQAKTTASRAADLQVGVGFVLDNSDYSAKELRGVAFYTTLDLSTHFGGEFEIHQANSQLEDNLYERTYEIGPRYFRTYGRYKPYIKAMYGRGVFNFIDNVANLAYNIFAIGGGVDIAIKPYLNVRGDYEYQTWRNFPPDGLTPQVFTIGVAYHFPGGLRRGEHY